MKNMPPDPFNQSEGPELGQLPPDLLFISGLDVGQLSQALDVDAEQLQQAKDRANAALEVLKDGMSPQAQAIAQTELEAAKQDVFTILGIDTEENKEL